jgi:hypothetical protein
MSGAAAEGAAAAGAAAAAPADGEGDAASALGADGEQTLATGGGQQTLIEEAPSNPAPAAADGASATELQEKEKEKRNETFGVELPADFQNLTIDEKLRHVPPVKVRVPVVATHVRS